MKPNKEFIREYADKYERQCKDKDRATEVEIKEWIAKINFDNRQN